VLLHQVKDLAIALEPFIPFTSAAIFRQLNAKQEKWDGIGKLTLKAGHKLGSPQLLFRKIEGGGVAKAASAIRENNR
jgi:methionyl-tRNA synthetase